MIDYIKEYNITLVPVNEEDIDDVVVSLLDKKYGKEYPPEHKWSSESRWKAIKEKVESGSVVDMINILNKNINWWMEGLLVHDNVVYKFTYPYPTMFDEIRASYNNDGSIDCKVMFHTGVSTFNGSVEYALDKLKGIRVMERTFVDGKSVVTKERVTTEVVALEKPEFVGMCPFLFKEVVKTEKIV